MARAEMEQSVQLATDGWMNDMRKLRNSWIRKYAENKGLTEKDFLRMVIDFDIKVAGSGNLPASRMDAEEKYRKWFELTDEIKLP